MQKLIVTTASVLALAVVAAGVRAVRDKVAVMTTAVKPTGSFASVQLVGLSCVLAAIGWLLFSPRGFRGLLACWGLSLCFVVVNALRKARLAEG